MGMWLVYALLSAATAALVAIFGKIGLKDVDANAATALRAIVMTAFLLGVVLAQGKAGHLGDVFAQRKAVLFLLLSGAAGAASWLFYFLALQSGKVSQVGPIDKLSVVLAVLLAYAFLGEKISYANAAGVALIAVGAILTALK